MWYLLLLLKTSCYAYSSTEHFPSYVVNSFEDADNVDGFSHIARDGRTGNLYIGSVNTIYELSSSLLRLRKVSSGPRDDNPTCLSPHSACSENRVPTNAVTKAMVIDSSNARLIVCSNLYQGFCERRHLSDINSIDPPSYIAVVPNDVLSSAVLLIAPGKIEYQQEERNVLYVAAERSVLAEERYRDVYALSTRKLNNFSLSYQDFFVKSGIRVDVQWRDTFRIRYITGFSHNGFTYFVAIQRADTTATNYITKLIRVCQGDIYGFRSYVEVPLECMNNGITYNIGRAAVVAKPGQDLFDNFNMTQHDNDKALFVLFSRSKSTDSLNPSSVSAMCVYKMSDINTKFTTNFHQCFDGSGFTGPNHLTSSKPCQTLDPSFHFSIGDDYCGAINLNYPIGSNSWPIKNTAVITWKNTSVTAVAVTSTSSHTVAFIGTGNGHIKKVVVDTISSATEYNDIPVDEGNPVNINLLFGEQDNYLYVTTVRKVTRIKVEECDTYKSCTECVINTKDPYCGWCPLESKCSRLVQPRYLTFNNAGHQCPEITKVSPSQIHIEGTQTNLTINIQDFPCVAGARYDCAFYQQRGTSPLIQQATKTDGGVTCYTPPRNSLPNITVGRDHFTMQLAVRINDQDVVATNLSFFICTLHSSCTPCTNSSFLCTWCARNFTCTNHRISCGDSNVLVTGEHVAYVSERNGPDQCPMMTKNPKTPNSSGTNTIRTQNVFCSFLLLSSCVNYIVNYRFC